MNPAHDPLQPAIVFDGQCPFCQRQIARIRKRDTRGVFEYLPKQTEGVDRRFPQLADGDFNTGMRLVHPDGSVSVGADAVYEIAKQLRGWRWLAWLYRVPVLHALCRWGYAWIAQNRYKLGKTCEHGACEIKP